VGDGDGGTNLAMGRQVPGHLDFRNKEWVSGCGTAVDVMIVDGGRVAAVGHHPHNHHRCR
jgi:hypothetical protein